MNKQDICSNGQSQRNLEILLTVILIVLKLIEISLVIYSLLKPGL